MEVTRDAADDRTPATNGKLAVAPLVMRRARRVTAAEHPRPQLRGRSLPGNLIGRRGAALAPPILLAVGLNVAAVTGLAGIAGFHAVYASLIRIQWPWLCAVPAALGVSAIGYYFAYQGIYAAEGGYELSRRQLTAVVAAGRCPAPPRNPAPRPVTPQRPRAAPDPAAAPQPGTINAPRRAATGQKPEWLSGPAARPSLP